MIPNDGPRPVPTSSGVRTCPDKARGYYSAASEQSSAEWRVDVLITSNGLTRDKDAHSRALTSRRKLHRAVAVAGREEVPQHLAMHRTTGYASRASGARRAKLSPSLGTIASSPAVSGAR